MRTKSRNSERALPDSKSLRRSVFSIGRSSAIHDLTAYDLYLRAYSMFFSSASEPADRLDGLRRLEIENDALLPGIELYEHVNSGDRPAFLFSFSDAPVMKALSLYRDETRA
jgi:hypothetical protein